MGLLEVVWKLAEAVIVMIIKAAVEFHDVLHRFLTGRGTGTLILEIKLVQELESVEQLPLFVVLLELSEEYDNIDRRCLL